MSTEVVQKYGENEIAAYIYFPQGEIMTQTGTYAEQVTTIGLPVMSQVSVWVTDIAADKRKEIANAVRDGDTWVLRIRGTKFSAARITAEQLEKRLLALQYTKSFRLFN